MKLCHSEGTIPVFYCRGRRHRDAFQHLAFINLTDEARGADGSDEGHNNKKQELFSESAGVVFFYDAVSEQTSLVMSPEKSRVLSRCSY